MGAAPVLILLAAVGVDYGWQPDGTTSSRGDNIEYIVQIPPEQLQQIRSLGEITSAIDPSVQGRVSRIVVKIGNQPLPRIAGQSAALPAKLASDESIIPIPEMSDALAANALQSSNAASSMKPDPQGGISLPESAQAAGQSAFDQLRAGAKTQAEALSKSVGDAAAQATNSFQNGFAAPQPNAAGSPPNSGFGFPGSAMPGSVTTRPPTIPPSAAGRDNRWDVLPTSTATNSGPSTDPVASQNRNAPWSTTPTTPPLTGTSPTSSFGTPPTFANSGFAAPPLSTLPNVSVNTNPFNPPAAAPTLATPPRNPTDPNWTGYGTNPNFGNVPGMSAPRSNFDTLATSAASVAATLPSQNPDDYRQDAAGNMYNRNNELVDKYGYPIDRSGNRLNQTASNPAAPFPAQSSVYGETRPAYPSTASLPSTSAPLQYENTTWGKSASYAATPYSQTPASAAADPFGRPNTFDAGQFSQSPYSQSPVNETLAAAQRVQAQTEAQLAETQRQLRRYQERDPAQTRMVNFEDEAASASDLRSRQTMLNEKAERDRIAAAVAEAGKKPQRIAAQPFFNFVLLISLVGNAYLIFETNNLRRKFRNMISSMRTSKVAAQAMAS